MDFRGFEERLRKLIPEFLLRQFNHILSAIPENYRFQFLEHISRTGDMAGALHLVATSAGPVNKPIREYIHQRLQDNMSEIMD